MRRYRAWIVLGLLILFVNHSLALAQPAKVLIIHHAETPQDSSADNLSIKGQERAMAFVPFFTQTPELVYQGLPVALFATKAVLGNFHQYTLETLTPLSNRLRVLVDAHYAKTDYADLAQELLTNPKYERKTVLVCWDHDYIPRLAATLGVVPQPSAWPADVFDRIWIITYKDGCANLQNMPQRLLFGDSLE